MYESRIYVQPRCNKSNWLTILITYWALTMAQWAGGLMLEEAQRKVMTKITESDRVWQLGVFAWLHGRRLVICRWCWHTGYRSQWFYVMPNLMRLGLKIWAIGSPSSRMRWGWSSELWRCSYESEQWGSWLDTTQACRRLAVLCFTIRRQWLTLTPDWTLTLWKGTRHWPHELETWESNSLRSARRIHRGCHTHGTVWSTLHTCWSPRLVRNRDRTTVEEA